MLLSYSKIAIFEPELPECISRTTFVLKSCDFPAGAAIVHFACYPELPEYTSRTTFVRKSCDFQARAGRVHFAYYFRT